MFSSHTSHNFLNMGGHHFTHSSRRKNNEVLNDLTVEAVRDLRVVFACYQSRASSTITIHQLADIVELLGDPRPTTSNLKTTMSESVTGSCELEFDRVNFKTFVRFFINRLSAKNVGVRSKEIFRALDWDNSGEVSAEELQESLKNMGLSLNKDEVLAMTSVADTSKEGQINYSQFKHVWKRVDEEHDFSSQNTAAISADMKSKTRTVFSTKGMPLPYNSQIFVPKTWKPKLQKR